MKDISEKVVVLSGFRIPITNTPELDGAILCFGAGQQDGMARRQAPGLDHLAAVNNPVLDPLLQTSDEEDLFLSEPMQPVKIQ